jgi:hypothetical protein
VLHARDGARGSNNEMRERIWLGVVGGACALALFVAACANGSSAETGYDVDAGGGPAVDDGGARDARAPFDAGSRGGDGSNTGGDAGSGDDSGNGNGDSGTGGSDGAVTLPPFQAHALVGGGVTSKSPSYVLTHSLSQSPGGNDTQTSPSYHLYGGIVGATP